MSNPLGLLSLAMAARGGVIDNLPASQLVAAGLSILQRCAPLARALYGKRSAILLPTSPLFLTALAASDGRGAVLMNPSDSATEISARLLHANVGAVFTIDALSGKIQAGLPTILLDAAPQHAVVRMPGREMTIDLGSHVGLTIEADADSADDGSGDSEEEAVLVYASATSAAITNAASFTHRDLLALARATIAESRMVATDHILATVPYCDVAGLTQQLIAPMLAGARVTTLARVDPQHPPTRQHPSAPAQ
jgi:acyl-CoA synthetase (AMP-forming)/AMP-acid ligase II